MKKYKIIGLTSLCKDLTVEDREDLENSIGCIIEESEEISVDGDRLFSIPSSEDVHEDFLILEEVIEDKKIITLNELSVKIEILLDTVCDNFISKWDSHYGKNEGIKEYSNEIISLVKDYTNSLHQQIETLNKENTKLKKNSFDGDFNNFCTEDYK
jgi:hypothetical protein